MSLPKEFYIVIYKDDFIESIKFLEDVLRADIKLVFHAKLRKSTKHNTFYNYETMNAKGVVYKNNSFIINGIKCKVNSGEFWGEIRKKASGVVLSIDIKDKLGKTLEKRIHNDDDKLKAFKTLIKYLNLLNRVGTHQGALEVCSLLKEVENLNKKLNQLEK